MKTLYAVVILFVASLLGVAVWFGPLCGLGTPTAYDNNEPVSTLDGLCYPSDALCREDFSGSEKDMHKALDSIFAVTVKEVKTDDGLTIVYALSPRVCAAKQYLRSGEAYNVMAAYSSGNISIGTPILSGSY
ncbi:MAG: hypothetical protein K2O39_06850 [Clostridiales bacterium]|nr:hypothetical protein [Clostridiales bacterium]